MFDKLLDKLRELFSKKYREFKEYLKDEAPDLAIKAIEFAETNYDNCGGHEKMEAAIQFILENLHIPAIYAVMASRVILKAVEAFIQDAFDNLKEKLGN